MTDTPRYRPKFVDIRVKKPKVNKKTSRAAKPDEKKCDREGCEKLGEFPALKSPKDNDNSERFWFCQQHAAEYNKAWDFFKDMNPAQIQKFQAGIITGHLPTWDMKASNSSREAAAASLNMARGQFRDVFQAFAANKERARGQTETTDRRPKLGRLERQALVTLGLDETATPQEIRDTYRGLVKKFHPDSNGGDRTAEERFHSVIKAYKTLENGTAMKGL